MLDLDKIRQVLADGQSRSFYRLAEELVGANALSDYTLTVLLAQQLENELPTHGGFTIENGLVGLSGAARLDEWN